MGATHIINANKKNVKEEIMKILNGYSLDLFIDNTGISKIIELGYEITSSNGRVILVGVPRLDDNIKIYSLQLHFGKKLTGSHGGNQIHMKIYLDI